MKSEKINDKLNVLYIIPRYRTYGMEGHYVMPMGILYVSAYVKRSGIANVFTLNLNHESGEEFDILQSYFCLFKRGCFSRYLRFRYQFRRIRFRNNQSRYYGC